MGLINLLRKKCNISFFTTPSHSRCLFIFHKLRNLYKYDISETEFHNPEEALKKAEEAAAKLYGTKSTKFLTNGSTSGIITAVLSCVKKGDNVLIWKDAHPCHKNAVELAGGATIYYQIPQDPTFKVAQKTSPEILEPYFENNKIKALIITSPTYEGFVSDIKAIKDLCAKHNCYLIVDEAHGALYPFSERLPQSAVKIADFTVQSLHKTAGGLNPTALIHTNTNIDLKEALSKTNTTSPSYPLLASIEANINFLKSSRGKRLLNNLIDRIEILRKNCPECIFGGDDITKILVKIEGLTGYQLSEILYNKYKIEDERTNEVCSMLLCGIGTSTQKLDKLEKALFAVSQKN